MLQVRLCRFPGPAWPGLALVSRSFSEDLEPLSSYHRVPCPRAADGTGTGLSGTGLHRRRVSRRVSSEASSEFAAAPSARISASAPSGRQPLESHGSLSRRGHKGWGPLGWQITLSATHMSLCPHPHDDPPIGALGGHCASSWWHWVLGVKVNVRHASDSLSDLRSQPDVEMSSSQMVQPTGEEEAASVGTEERDNARLGFVVIAGKGR